MSSPASTPAPQPSGIVEINLGAVRENYRLMQSLATHAEVTAAVKADAYGLGLGQVAQVLWDEGCRGFFVATMTEGAALKEHLPQGQIFVLDGLMEGDEAHCAEHRLIPVLNDPGQIERWQSFGKANDFAAPLVVHVDTGINRLGLTEPEWQTFCDNASGPVAMVMSHLACASMPAHEQNVEQLNAFQRVVARVPDTRASLANSAGLCLGPDYHFDAARVGIALYGGEPVMGQTHGINPVVSLKVRILQIHDVPVGGSVGYNAAFTAKRPTRIATIEAGYADGLGTVFSNAGLAYLGDYKIPVVGRVSMDLITLDVTDVPEPLVHPGEWVDVLGEHQTIDDLAGQGGLIPYEILTGLGRRFERRYIDSQNP